MTNTPAISLNQHPTLVEWIEHHALHQPDAEALCFIGQRAVGTDINDDVRLTYSALSECVKCCTASWQQCTNPGDRALILFPSDIDYVVSLLACFYAGVTDVPVNLPGAAKAGRHHTRLQANLVISNKEETDASNTDLQAFANEHGLHLLQLEDLQEESSQIWQHPQRMARHWPSCIKPQVRLVSLKG